MNLIEITKEFQRLNGLVDDGIPGLVTMGAALALAKNCEKAIYDEKEVAPMRVELIKFDERTEENLSTLLPAAQAKFGPFIAAA